MSRAVWSASTDEPCAALLVLFLLRAEIDAAPVRDAGIFCWWGDTLLHYISCIYMSSGVHALLMCAKVRDTQVSIHVYNVCSVV